VRRHPRDAGERTTARLLPLLARRAEADALPALVVREDARPMSPAAPDVAAGLVSDADERP
jgi:hypothetical protein